MINMRDIKSLLNQLPFFQYFDKDVLLITHEEAFDKENTTYVLSNYLIKNKNGIDVYDGACSVVLKPSNHNKDLDLTLNVRVCEVGTPVFFDDKENINNPIQEKASFTIVEDENTRYVLQYNEDDVIAVSPCSDDFDFSITSSYKDLRFIPVLGNEKEYFWELFNDKIHMDKALNKLVNDLKPAANYIKELNKQAFLLYAPEVDFIIQGNIKDEEEIEYLLDCLLSFPDDPTYELFVKLVNYYKEFNEDAAIDYENIYLDMYGPDENIKSR